MKKILLVDDEKGVVAMMKSYFEMSGYQVLTAYNGAEALRQAVHQPDIILLDINMPGMNGIQVLQKLKEQRFLGKVIMLTCYDEFEYVREAMRGGASDYVLKAGMNETGLLDAVKRLEYDKKGGEGPKQDQEPKTEQMLRRRMDGYSIGGEDQFDFHGDCFCCVAVKIKNMQEVEKVLKRIQKKKGKGRYAMAVASITVLGLVAFGILLTGESKIPEFRERLTQVTDVYYQMEFQNETRNKRTEAVKKVRDQLQEMLTLYTKKDEQEHVLQMLRANEELLELLESEKGQEGGGK